MTIKCEHCGYIPKPAEAIMCSGSKCRYAVCPSCDFLIDTTEPNEIRVQCEKCSWDASGTGLAMFLQKCPECGSKTIILENGFKVDKESLNKDNKGSWTLLHRRLYMDRGRNYKTLTYRYDEENKMTKGLCIECKHHEVVIIKLGINAGNERKESLCNYFFNPVNGEATNCSFIRIVGEHCGQFEAKCKCELHNKGC